MLLHVVLEVVMRRLTCFRPVAAFVSISRCQLRPEILVKASKYATMDLPNFL